MLIDLRGPPFDIGPMQPSNEIGFGIIGAGNIAQVHAEALRDLPGARLRAVLARDEARTRPLAERHGAEAVTDADRFFARPDIHAVSICTPSGTHAELGIRAAAAGKHVLVEKPIDVTLDRARALIEACRRHGVQLGVIFQSRFMPAVAFTKRLLDGGLLGRLYVADAYVKWYRAPAYYEAARWRGTLALDGGGALINQSIHTVDLLQHFAGPVAQVFGHTARLRHPQIEGEDTAVAVLKYKSGAMGVLEGTTSVAPGYPRRLELHGERGSLVLDGNDVTALDVEGASAEKAELERLRQAAKDASDGSSNPMNLDVTAHRRQFEDFVAAVRDGRSPLLSGDEGLKALEIVLAVYRSAGSGQPVALPLAAC
jgi:UDP-N-acetyl-2-amino-2-deoxyglucuronate dehydrogenase